MSALHIQSLSGDTSSHFFKCRNIVAQKDRCNNWYKSYGHSGSFLKCNGEHKAMGRVSRIREGINFEDILQEYKQYSEHCNIKLTGKQ